MNLKRQKSQQRVCPTWPLPNVDKLSQEAIQQRFSKWKDWHYDFVFEGADDPESRNKRALWRFNHFFPALVESLGGSLEGKTVLDLGSNSGFWSIQAALLGANVIGVEGRLEQVEQARLVASLAGVDNVEFIHGDYWDLHETLKGKKFDAVLNLGILYHLPDPYHALAHLMPLIGAVTVIDTTVINTEEPTIKINWEEPDQIQQATRSGIVAIPSPSVIELMLKDLKFSKFTRLPVDVESSSCPPDFKDGWRVTWIAVK